jgi:hypothetical protein
MVLNEDDDLSLQLAFSPLRSSEYRRLREEYDRVVPTVVVTAISFRWSLMKFPWNRSRRSSTDADYEKFINDIRLGAYHLQLGEDGLWKLGMSGCFSR